MFVSQQAKNSPYSCLHLPTFRQWKKFHFLKMVGKLFNLFSLSVMNCYITFALQMNQTRPHYLSIESFILNWVIDLEIMSFEILCTHTLILTNAISIQVVEVFWKQRSRNLQLPAILETLTMLILEQKSNEMTMLLCGYLMVISKP